MENLNATNIATQIINGTILSELRFYSIWLIISVVGSAFGVWIREKIRGDVSKDIWFTQESWKEKYRLYQVLISGSEEIAGALWNIYTDVRVLDQMGLKDNSLESDGLKLFPEHKQYLDTENCANQKLLSAEVGVTLMLNDKAKDALASIRKANTQTTYAINMSYHKRIGIRCDAASKAKFDFINAAKNDLKT